MAHLLPSWGKLYQGFKFIGTHIFEQDWSTGGKEI
jgi:hypothetical protein